MYQLIEDHYLKNRQKLLKRLSFRAGGFHQAEDIIQEAYYRAMKYYGSCRDGEFDQWFSMIVQNCFNDYMREESGLSYLEEEDEQEGSVDCSITGDQTIKEVYALIKAKDEAPRLILSLHVKHDYSAIDISKITPYTYAMVHKTISRFRQEVRKMYE